MGQILRDLDVKLITAAGVEVPQQNGLLTLANGTTYYAELGGAAGAGLSAVQWCWDTALVAAITYESTNLPPADASTFAAAGALWYPEPGPGTTSIPGGSAGTVVQHLADFGARRMRAKIVVTTGGAAQLRGRMHFKTAEG